MPLGDKPGSEYLLVRNFQYKDQFKVLHVVAINCVIAKFSLFKSMTYFSGPKIARFQTLLRYRLLHRFLVIKRTSGTVLKVERLALQMLDEKVKASRSCEPPEIPHDSIGLHKNVISQRRIGLLKLIVLHGWSDNS